MREQLGGGLQDIQGEPTTQSLILRILRIWKQRRPLRTLFSSKTTLNKLKTTIYFPFLILTSQRVVFFLLVSQIKNTEPNFWFWEGWLSFEFLELKIWTLSNVCDMDKMETWVIFLWCWHPFEIGISLQSTQSIKSLISSVAIPIHFILLL